LIGRLLVDVQVQALQEFPSALENRRNPVVIRLHESQVLIELGDADLDLDVLRQVLY